MKKLSFVLALCMLFACVSTVLASASIYNGTVIDGIEYYFLYGKYSVVGFTDDIPEKAVVLSSLKGYPVKAIRSDALHHCPAKAIFIPDSIIDIGSLAFANDSIKDIYCEAPSKPSGWDSDWKAFWNSAEVHWGASVNDMTGGSSSGGDEMSDEYYNAIQYFNSCADYASNYSAENYTEDSWNILQNALAFDPEGKTPEEIREAAEAINYAILGLEPIRIETILGDINQNGKLDARDYLLLKRAFFGTYELSCGLDAADINGNGKLDARDYLLLKRAFFGTYSLNNTID